MNDRPSAIKPCEKPGEASVEEGFVLLDGPDGVAVTMTAEAAALTAESLRLAAQAALAAQGTGTGTGTGIETSLEGESDEEHTP